MRLKRERTATMRHHGGTAVRGGFYWNLSRWTIVTMPKDGGLLPGHSEHSYVRLPVLALLAVAPLMGGLYVMFLPFVGFALVAAALGRKTVDMMLTAVGATAATVAPSWQPGEAHFVGKPTRRAADETKHEI
jgi:hypothetical protein